MSPLAKLATRIVLAAGYGALAWSIGHWESAEPGLFLGYLAAAIAAGWLCIRIPAFSGSLSLHFFFVLVCIARLSLPETIVIACAGTLLQCVRHQKPFRWSAAGLEIAVAAAATVLAYATYHKAGAAASAPGPWPLHLVLAATVFFLANSIPAAAVTALTQGRRFGQPWQEYYFWTFPHYVAGGGAAGLLVLLNDKAGWETALLILPLTYWMYHSYRFYLQRLETETRQARELGALQFRTLEALAVAIEGHDPTKHGHLRRVSLYATAIGREMGLSQSELQALHAAAMLHDIGKLAVPEHILTKRGKLSKAEFERVKIHPVAGAEILEQVRFPYPVAPIVRAHHEKWDGTGYPAGLKGEAIPVGARILAAVDCLDALVSDRYHRRALPLEKAVQYLRTESGRSFDPRVVEILVKRYRGLEAQIQAEERSQRPYSPDAAAAGCGLEPANAAPAEGAAFLAGIAAARREEQILFQLARELGNSLSLDETLAICALHLKTLCPYDSIAIYIRRDDVLVAEYASGESFWSFGLREAQWGQGLVGWVAETRTPVLNADPGADSQSGSTPALASALAAPLEGAGGVVGVITLYARGKDAFSLDQLRILSAVAAQAALSVENALKYSQAERSATTDVLTGLPNARSLFLHLDAELARARRQSAPVAVLVCDLDGFKQVNDRFGHLEGNRILKAVAQALKRQCREYDFVARMGGDEFVLVLPGNGSGSLTERIEQFRTTVEAAALETLPEARIGLSAGAACYPADGGDAESLLVEADRRMYQMKQERKSPPAAADPLQRLSAGLGAAAR